MNILITGGGKVGAYLAALLLQQHDHVRIVELREDRVARLCRELPENTIVHGNATDPQVLESIGIRRAQAVIAVTGADETNLVIASIAHFEFNVPRIVARVNNPKNAWLFTPALGVDLALNQTDTMVQLALQGISESNGSIENQVSNRS